MEAEEKRTEKERRAGQDGELEWSDKMERGIELELIEVGQRLMKKWNERIKKKGKGRDGMRSGIMGNQ